MIDAKFFLAFLGRSSYDVKMVEVNLFKMFDECVHNGLLAIQKARTGVNLKIYCECCGKHHLFNFSLKSLINKREYHIYCPECNLELACLGRKTDVKKIVEMHKKEVENIIKEMGLEDFFENPFVIYDLINYIHDLAENRKIICQCGSRDINAKFKFDKIELICKKCGGISPLKAGSYEDLETIKKMESIVINTNHGRNKVIKY